RTNAILVHRKHIHNSTIPNTKKMAQKAKKDGRRRKRQSIKKRGKGSRVAKQPAEGDNAQPKNKR
ncbi:MAG: hypothetical protein LBT52_01615, partial [Clostridiales Family XIII bacterium]|nr:hypothetical protein [Clostridiales Family XIII bacterium]